MRFHAFGPKKHASPKNAMTLVAAVPAGTSKLQSFDLKTSWLSSLEASRWEPVIFHKQAPPVKVPWRVMNMPSSVKKLHLVTLLHSHEKKTHLLMNLRMQNTLASLLKPDNDRHRHDSEHEPIAPTEKRYHPAYCHRGTTARTSARQRRPPQRVSSVKAARSSGRALGAQRRRNSPESSVETAQRRCSTDPKLGLASLLGTSASLLVTSALLVVTRTLLGAPGELDSLKKYKSPEAEVLSCNPPSAKSMKQAQILKKQH